MNPNPPNETPEDGGLQLAGTDALSAIERSQIDVQISTAKKYPRSLKTFLDEASGMIGFSSEVAEGCSYKLKRKNKEGGVTIIEGPSIRLMEIAASSYGNLRYGSRVVAITEEYVRTQGMAFDLEKNIAVSVEVDRSIKGKFGRFSQDMIMVTANAAGSIARRNALLGVIPRVYVQGLAEHAKKVALGDIKTLPERRQRAFDYFTKTLGVPLEKVLEYLEKKSVEDCTLADVSELQDLKTALKDGVSTLEETFNGKPTPTTPGPKPPLESKAEAKAQQEPPKQEAPKREAPLPNQGPKNKGPKPEQSSSHLQNADHIPDAAAGSTSSAGAGQNSGSDLKLTTGPTADGPAKTVEQAAPNPGSVGSAKEVAQPATTSGHDVLSAALNDHGVSFDDFTDWLVNSGRYHEAKTMKSVSDLPENKVAEILNESAGKRPLDRCLQMFGKK